jgi:hypothetical protein
LRPRISMTAVWDSAGSRGSARASNMRLTLRGIIDPWSIEPSASWSYITQLSHRDLRNCVARMMDSDRTVARPSLVPVVQPVYGRRSAFTGLSEALLAVSKHRDFLRG